jgi:hypothetical protein
LGDFSSTVIEEVGGGRRRCGVTVAVAASGRRAVVGVRDGKVSGRRDLTREEDAGARCETMIEIDGV